MWREAKSRVSTTLDSYLTELVLTSSLGRLPRDNDEGPVGHPGGNCQEIGLVAIMFFFELLFSYVSLQFPSMFSSLTYSQSFFSPIC